MKGVTFRQALNGALDKGLQIDRKDDSLFTFSTLPKADKSGVSHIFYIRIKDSIALITGTFNLNLLYGGSLFHQTTSYDPIEVKGWKTGGYMVNFGYMDAFAKSFGLPVSYAKN